MYGVAVRGGNGLGTFKLDFRVDGWGDIDNLSVSASGAGMVDAVFRPGYAGTGGSVPGAEYVLLAAPLEEPEEWDDRECCVSVEGAV
jgi:hypothetical protein